MKRILCLVFAAVILCGSALAEDLYFRVPAVQVIRSGESAVIRYTKNRKAPDGTLAILDAGGNTLASVDVSSNTGEGKITVAPEKVPERGQVLTAVFTCDGQPAPQGEILLAVDDRKPGVYQVQTEEKKVAITFDSTGSMAKMDKLMDLLDRYGVKCTFFIQGGYIKDHPEKAILLNEHGHELANHSMYHPDMREIGNEQILNEIRDCNEIIKSITGQTVRYYRPPSGYFTYRDRAICRALGCELLLWTFDSNDWIYTKPQELVLGRLRKKTEPGSIILMHDYGMYTVPVLEVFIPEMQAQGYQFVTVSELMNSAGQKAE